MRIEKASAAQQGEALTRGATLPAKDFLRDLVRKCGVNIHPYPSRRHLTLDYPVSDVPRYGHGKGPHSKLHALINAERSRFDQVLDEIAANRDLIQSITASKTSSDPLEPFWNNRWLPPLDAAVLMHMLLKLRPRSYMEIGSGNSTAFARHAISWGSLPTQIVSIDPEPRRGIDEACDEVIRSPLEATDLTRFAALRAGDILFFDGSHRTFMDSDVTVFFLEVLPTLQPGVIVQVHDIFWPDDYPPQWGWRYYSEQYMLGLYLLLARPQVLMANAFVSTDPQLSVKAAALTPGEAVLDYWGVSFWFVSS